MIEVGIIGAGRLGNTHAGNLAKIDGVKLTAVYDINDEKSKAFQEKYGPAICSSPDELAQKVDVVIVSSPSDCHIEGVRAAVKAGKAVFTEKPFCRFASQAEEYRSLLKDFDKPFGIGFVRRHMLKTRTLKAMLDDGEIGRIRFCNVDLPFGSFQRMYDDWFADYKRSGGVILDMLAHHIDLANWFFGPAKRVYAQGLLLDPKQELPSDYVSATITYANGIIVNMMCNWQRFGRSGEVMEIYGEKGALTMNSTQTLQLAKLGVPVKEIEIDEKAQSVGFNNASTGNGFLNEMMNYMDAVRAGRKFTPGIPEAFSSFAVAEAMMRSAETNQIVEIN
ncbi:MAG: Gfo/Idh/MocA family oxidoreductase [Victivallales bacterium]|nr:Gfo/Idh/MocA family oxidoreductase [Victivallales bacterium]